MESFVFTAAKASLKVYCACARRSEKIYLQGTQNEIDDQTYRYTPR